MIQVWGTRMQKFKKRGWQTNQVQKEVKKCLKVCKGSQFSDKGWGEEWGGWSASKNIRSPTRIFISRSFRSSCKVKRRYRELATKFWSFTKLYHNNISLRTESGSKQRNEASQRFPVMQYFIKAISCLLKYLTSFFFLYPVKKLAKC